MASGVPMDAGTKPARGRSMPLPRAVGSGHRWKVGTFKAVTDGGKTV